MYTNRVTNQALAALTASELAQVGGGFMFSYLDDDWCGTGRIPLPKPDPQPDPWRFSGFDLVALNPQPLPPVDGLDMGLMRSF